METQFSEDDFYLPKPEIDAIKLEASDLPPAKEKEIKEISHEVNQMILKLYGKYLPPEARERLKEVSNRILVLPKEQFKVFRSEWEAEDPNHLSTSSAFNTDHGDMIVINEDDVNKQADKLRIIGGTDKDSYTFIIAHETIHFIQNQFLVRSLIETHASYCTREICKKLKIRQIMYGDINTRLAAYYNDLLTKTGELANKVVFGKDKTDEGKYSVYAQMNENRDELMKLFAPRKPKQQS